MLKQQEIERADGVLAPQAVVRTRCTANEELARDALLREFEQPRRTSVSRGGVVRVMKSAVTHCVPRVMRTLLGFHGMPAKVQGNMFHSSMGVWTCCKRMRGSYRAVHPRSMPIRPAVIA